MLNNFYPGMPGTAPYSPQNQFYGGFQQKCEITRVNGENGARAFQMAPNSSVLLLDESAPLIWLAQTDGAGYKTVTPYSITPYKPKAPVDTGDLEARIKRLEDYINGQSNSVTVAGATGKLTAGSGGAGEAAS